MKKLFLSSFIIILLVACSSADTKNIDNAADTAPKLPSIQSMKIDLSNFPKEDRQMQGLNHPGHVMTSSQTKTNFANAAIRVGVLNLALAAALTPPAAVFAVALSTEPTLEDGKYHWNFSANSGADQFKAHLTGWPSINNDRKPVVNLEMQVTCTACKHPVTDYLWYKGEFQTDGLEGFWIFYNPEIEGSDQSFVKIDYHIEGDSHADLTFTNIRTDGHEDAGDIIQYSLNDDTAKVQVHDQSKNLDYVIDWSVSNKNGSITVPDYNNGAKACWDEILVNAECE